MDVHIPPKNHPIALEKINSAKRIQFQGIVRIITNPKVPRIIKILMNGNKLTFNQKLQEMSVQLTCPLAKQKFCTFDGKISIKKAKVFEIARQVGITTKFEFSAFLQNVTRNAV